MAPIEETEGMVAEEPQDLEQVQVEDVHEGDNGVEEDDSVEVIT